MAHKILLTGGGSGGHIMPNLALAEYMKGRADIHYLGSGGMEKDLIGQVSYITYHTYSPPKFRRTLSPKNLSLPFAFARAYREALGILDSVKPDLVFTKGGYVGLPVAVATKKRKIHLFGHEADATLGLAHRLCLSRYDTLYSTFDLGKKARCVGALIRRQIYQGDRHRGHITTGFDGSKPILLVFGGSLGAQQLNDLVYSCRTQLIAKFDVFVICGKGKMQYTTQKGLHFTEFVSNIEDLYACCYATVIRGGSNSLCESVACGLPFVALPLLRSSRKEQLPNIRYFVQKNCGYLLDGTADNMLDSINRLQSNYTEHVRACRSIHIDATHSVAQALLDC